MLNNKDRISVILVETSHAGNIGATARAMKNMGLSNLILVNPKDDYQSGLAVAMAVGAKDILLQTKIVDSLEAAIADCQLVLATSARDRTRPWPMLSPREMGAKVVEEVVAHHHKVALIFGRERTGLKNEELQLAHYHVQIPTNPDFCSLNLSQAVQILCYEIQVAFGENFRVENQPVKNLMMSEYVNSEDLENFYQHLESLLVKVELIDPEKPMQTMTNLRRLFSRARLETLEVKLLRGVLAKVEKKLR